MYIVVVILGLLLLIFTIVAINKVNYAEKVKHKDEALNKFGTVKPALNAICEVCHLTFNEHDNISYECPNNALYNYKTKQYEIKE